MPVACNKSPIVYDVCPVPPWAAVTAALSVRMVAEAFGRVKVLVDVVGPVKAVNPLFVPPRDGAKIPVQPTVMDAAFRRAVVGLPPSVSVTFISSVLVNAPAEVKDGAALDPVALPKYVLAPALDSENESAGVVVGFATDVVKSGERLPLEKLDTVPPPDSPSHDFTAPRLVMNMVSFCSCFNFAPPQIVGCALAMPAIKSRAKSSVCFFIVFTCLSCPCQLLEKFD